MIPIIKNDEYLNEKNNQFPWLEYWFFIKFQATFLLFVITKMQFKNKLILDFNPCNGGFKNIQFRHNDHDEFNGLSINLEFDEGRIKDINYWVFLNILMTQKNIILTFRIL